MLLLEGFPSEVLFPFTCSHTGNLFFGKKSIFLGFLL